MLIKRGKMRKLIEDTIAKHPSWSSKRIAQSCGSSQQYTDRVFTWAKDPTAEAVYRKNYDKRYRPKSKNPYREQTLAEALKLNGGLTVREIPLAPRENGFQDPFSDRSWDGQGKAPEWFVDALTKGVLLSSMRR